MPSTSTPTRSTTSTSMPAELEQAGDKPGTYPYSHRAAMLDALAGMTPTEFRHLMMTSRFKDELRDRIDLDRPNP